jgi:hypothetical protein
MISLAGCCSSSHGETYFFSFAMHGKPARSPCYYYLFFWFSFYCYCCCPNPGYSDPNQSSNLSISLTHHGLTRFLSPSPPSSFLSYTHSFSHSLHKTYREQRNTFFLVFSLIHTFFVSLSAKKNIRNSISIISIQSNKPAPSPLSFNHSASPSTPCSCSTKKEPRANAPPAPAPAPAVTSNPTGGQSLAPAKNLKHKHW